jgi:hypothetical protein
MRRLTLIALMRFPGDMTAKFKLVVTATVKDAAGSGLTAKRTVTLRR